MINEEKKNKYIDFIKRYPLYSTLILLNEYEEKEEYEECAIIKEALDEYDIVFVKKNKHLTGDIMFPKRLEVYEGEVFQKILKEFDIVVDKMYAKNRAKLIKLNLPVKHG